MGLLVICAATVSGCASRPEGACPTGEGRAVHDMLYFGASTATGAVTPAQWSNFLSDTVTPRFPQGFTVVTGRGQWQSATGSMVAEDSWILDVVHPPGEASALHIMEIVGVYKARFVQEAVLRVTTTTCVALD